MRLFPLTLLLLLAACSRGCASSAEKDVENAVAASEDDELSSDKAPPSPRPPVENAAEDQAAPAD